MLARDNPGGRARNTDLAVTTPTATDEWAAEGPLVMIIAPDQALMLGLPTTPVKDGPYVIWAGPIPRSCCPVRPGLSSGRSPGSSVSRLPWPPPRRRR